MSAAMMMIALSGPFILSHSTSGLCCLQCLWNQASNDPPYCVRHDTNHQHWGDALGHGLRHQGHEHRDEPEEEQERGEIAESRDAKHGRQIHIEDDEHGQKHPEERFSSDVTRTNQHTRACIASTVFVASSDGASVTSPSMRLTMTAPIVAAMMPPSMMGTDSFNGR